VLLTHLYPHSIISLTIHVLSSDGSLLAACLNASTLALIDAGIPMAGYVTAVTVGSIAGGGGEDGKDVGDPILDVNSSEEQDGVPFLTIGCLGAPGHGTAGDGEGGDGEGDKVVVLVCESRVRVEALEGMVAVGVDGCAVVRGLLDKEVRGSGGRFLKGER
jgi:exosome complex component RRP41